MQTPSIDEAYRLFKTLKGPLKMGSLACFYPSEARPLMRSD